MIKYLGYNPIIQEARTLGEKLKKYRIERGMSITQLSKETGIDRDVLRRVEGGKVTLKKTVRKIRTYLHNCSYS